MNNLRIILKKFYKTILKNKFMKTSFVTKNILAWIILILSSSVYSQHTGITLVNIRNQKTISILENERIKIKTIEGKTLTGNFQIIDSETITVDNIAIPLSSIVKIKQRSLGIGILRTFAIAAGTILLIAALVGIVAGGLAEFITVFTLPVGLPLLIVPLSSNDHNCKKWSYKIFEN